MPKKPLKSSSITAYHDYDSNDESYMLMHDILNILEHVMLRLLEQIDSQDSLNQHDVLQSIRMVELLTRARKNQNHNDHSMQQHAQQRQHFIEKLEAYGAESGLNDCMLESFLQALKKL